MCVCVCACACACACLYAHVVKERGRGKPERGWGIPWLRRSCFQSVNQSGALLQQVDLALGDTVDSETIIHTSIFVGEPELV